MAGTQALFGSQGAIIASHRDSQRPRQIAFFGHFRPRDGSMEGHQRHATSVDGRGIGESAPGPCGLQMRSAGHMGGAPAACVLRAPMGVGDVVSAVASLGECCGGIGVVF